MARQEGWPSEVVGKMGKVWVCLQDTEHICETVFVVVQSLHSQDAFPKASLDP